MRYMTDDKKINLFLLVSYAAYVLLIGVIIWDSIVTRQKWLWLPLILQVLPLLLLLPGMLRLYYRSYSWLCFLSLAYFTSYVIQVYSPTKLWHDWLGLIATIVIFISAMFASRWLQRYFIKNAIKQAE